VERHGTVRGIEGEVRGLRASLDRDLIELAFEVANRR
jgi:hypothetical protein